jgi:hypothetical protein
MPGVGNRPLLAGEVDMPGPNGKPAATRARRNTTSTNAILRPQTEETKVEAPDLPKITGVRWQPMTRRWWKDLWDSPMAPEYDDADIHGLYNLAMLVNDFWMSTTARERQLCMQEIRLQGYRYGMSPMDRRRLQWEIEKTDEAQSRGSKRRAHEAPQAPAGPQPGQATGDPRARLHSVKGAGPA